jgi:hypothetical protein
MLPSAPSAGAAQVDPRFEAVLARFNSRMASEDSLDIAADNMLIPETARPEAEAYRRAVKSKGNLQSLLLPIGNGIELSCVWPAAQQSGD